jgi:hypothetical protein
MITAEMQAYLNGSAMLMSHDELCEWKMAEGEAEAERAYERHLEDAGYWEARAQEEFEASCGIRDPQSGFVL